MLLWEIVTLGCPPLEDMEVEDIVAAAQEEKLAHPL